MRRLYKYNIPVMVETGGAKYIHCLINFVVFASLCLSLESFVVQKSYANPVSFKDGWGIMPSFGVDWSDLDINYSLTNRYALGVSRFERKGEDSSSTFGIARVNYLVKRWNELNSQGNLYISTGLGSRHDSRESDSLAAFGAIEGDYETRRIYTLVGYETLQSPGGVDYNRLRARAGVAPYLTDFDSVHTWIVAQVDHMPEMEDPTEVTPLLRFFFDNYAFEAGVSLSGNAFIAAMAHF